RFLSEIDAGFQANTGSQDYEGMFGSAWASAASHQTGGIGGVSPTSALANEPRYVPDLDEGDGVRHAVFGTGTIMEKDGDMVTVYFKGKGAKKLNLGFAPLEKL